MKKFIILFFLLYPFEVFSITQWSEVAPGIAYANIINKNSPTLSSLHAFKINLKQNDLQLALAKDGLLPATTVKWLAEKNQALLAVNGGFFTPFWQTIGLRIQNGKVRSPLQKTSWWHIFYITHQTPYIITEKEYETHSLNLSKNSTITLAIQGGPRLLANGEIPTLKPGKAQRTALGITRDGQVIIIGTEHWRMSTTDLAHLLQAPESENGLNCIEGLNLDGGNSSQLYANTHLLQLNISNFSLITDILYVTRKI